MVVTDLVERIAGPVKEDVGFVDVGYATGGVPQ